MLSETLSDEVQRLRQELDRCGRETKQLLDGVVHDLRAAERGIRTSAEALSIGLSKTLNGDAEAAFLHLLEEITKMNLILTGVSSYSISLPVAGCRFGRVPMEIALHSALASLDAEIRESEAVISHGALPGVSGDGERFTLLFRNLIDNALKYRSAEAPRIGIQAEQKAEDWVFSVQDNGIGIDQKYWDGLFTPFKRLHGAEIPGVGLGLVICRRILETHGGRIWIESKAGRGARFLFSLPIETGTSVSE
jgi:chemotaxis family two-component system sensor kinase Cph1